MKCISCFLTSVGGTPMLKGGKWRGRVAVPGSGPVMEVMRADRTGFDSNLVEPAGGARGNARRGAEWIALGQPEQPLPLGLFLRKREWGNRNMGARPLLETFPTGARRTSPRRAKRRGSSGERRMSLLHSLQASPHACEALQSPRSSRGSSGLFSTD